METEIEQWLLNWFKDKTGKNVQTNINYLAESVIDSLGVFELISEIEDEYNIYFEEEDLLNPLIETIHGFSTLIASKIER